MSDDIPEMDLAAVAEVGLPDIMLVDVREQHEWDAGHAAHAVHVPLGDLAARMGELPQDQQLQVVCKAGGRSARATQMLRSQGYDAVNVRGGMTAWHEAGRPMVSETGDEPTIVAP